jgi:hypothetical protein
MKRYEFTAAQGIHRGLRQTPRPVNNKTLFDPPVLSAVYQQVPVFLSLPTVQHFHETATCDVRSWLPEV